MIEILKKICLRRPGCRSRKRQNGESNDENGAKTGQIYLKNGAKRGRVINCFKQLNTDFFQISNTLFTL